VVVVVRLVQAARLLAGTAADAPRRVRRRRLASTATVPTRPAGAGWLWPIRGRVLVSLWDVRRGGWPSCDEGHFLGQCV
jgi:hypothetical protein